mmetsp:Transcript_53053/g.95491  ORF Transcript_53053/g.95491 Transcript_53053/m.95491 type:complete len:347 (-) Transcript_53053:62-1102(-)
MNCGQVDQTGARQSLLQPSSLSILMVSWIANSHFLCLIPMCHLVCTVLVQLHQPLLVLCQSLGTVAHGMLHIHNLDLQLANLRHLALHGFENGHDFRLLCLLDVNILSFLFCVQRDFFFLPLLCNILHLLQSTRHHAQTSGWLRALSLEERQHLLLLLRINSHRFLDPLEKWPQKAILLLKQTSDLGLWTIWGRTVQDLESTLQVFLCLHVDANIFLVGRVLLSMLRCGCFQRLLVLRLVQLHLLDLVLGPCELSRLGVDVRLRDGAAAGGGRLDGLLELCLGLSLPRLPALSSWPSSASMSPLSGPGQHPSCLALQWQCWHGWKSAPGPTGATTGFGEPLLLSAS